MGAECAAISIERRHCAMSNKFQGDINFKNRRRKRNRRKEGNTKQHVMLRDPISSHF
jgi:hypothetical protein